MTLLQRIDITLPGGADTLGDRQRARLRADARSEIVRRAQRGITIYPAFLVVLGLGSDVATDHPWAYFTLLGLVVAMLVARAAIARSLRALEAESVPAFQLYLLLGWLSSTALTGFIAALVLWYGDKPVVSLGQIGMTGISAGVIVVMSIHRRLACAWSLSGMIPLALCNLLTGTSLGYSLAAMLVLYVLVSMPIIDRSHEMYWRGQIGTAMLDQRAHEAARMARRAGMAEIAAGVLHDVGNVLNSVRISAQSLDEQARSDHGSDLRALVGLLVLHRRDLSEFLRDDEKGRLVLPYLERLAEQLTHDHTVGRAEIARLTRHLDHIAMVVSSQQEHARGGRTSEEYPAEQLARDAIDLVEPDFAVAEVAIDLEIRTEATAMVDVHQSLQVLVNMLSNARDALLQVPAPRRIRVSVEEGDDGRPRIRVADHGCGISRDVASKIFTHGFTTKPRGHGFGLHHSFLVAKAMGGRLEFESAGVGRGATFTLVLPNALQQLRREHAAALAGAA